ncbi:MAG: hypothetical protein IPH62_00270 [Ignavibacteriae bacterium]|nr:hypothetical protein [Ignavibacteriota bacterium]
MKCNLCIKFFLTVFAITLVSILFTNCIKAQDNDYTKKYLKNAQREDHFGIPFLYLKGTDYEVGYQYGYLLKNELKSFYEVFEQFKEEFLDKEISYLPWYTRVFANIFGSMVFKYKINGYANRLNPDILEQIKGASESSDLPESFFKQLLVFYDMYSNRCEAVIIEKGNHTYHAHNLDQPAQLNMLSKYPVVVNYEIDGKQKYTDFGFTGLLMTTTAFNESGLSISENGNNNPRGFDKEDCTLYSEKSKLITETHNLKEVDSIANTLKFPVGIIFTIGSSKEKKAAVYDFIGSTKAATKVDGYKFIANRTVSKELGKKSETIYAGKFHEEARVVKFAELIDTSKQNMVDEIIGILSNTSFYHYSDHITVHIESLHNYETDQSVIFDLADSTVYFTYYSHYASWNSWLKYNYITRKVSVYKEADPRLSDPLLAKLNNVYGKYEACDWRDSSNVRSLLDSVIESQIENYFSLNFLSKTYLDYYKSPVQSLIYAQKLIDKYPDIITGYFQKGRVLEEQKHYQGAIDQYKLASESKINCEYFLAVTYEHLAVLYSNSNEKELAKEYANKSLYIYNQYWTPEHLKENIRKLESIKSGMIDRKTR